MNLVFWTHSPSQHVIPMFECIAANSEHKVILIIDYFLSASRQKIGWKLPPPPKNIQLVVAPNKEIIKQIIEESPEGSYHIFSGINTSNTIRKGLKEAIRYSNIRIGIYAEPYNWLGITGFLRYIRSLIRRIKYGKHITIFLGIGNKGVEVFKRAGHAKEKIFEFAYVQPPIDIKEIPDDIHNIKEPYRIMFAGSLIKRKGVDILLKALNRIEEKHIMVNIFGEGTEEPYLLKLINDYQLDFVRIHHFTSYQRLLQHMREHDLFILPSRRDGWGGVVSEALTMGTPVICSSHCGSSILMNDKNQSIVFSSGNYRQLACLINEKIRKGKIHIQERQQIRVWAHQISAEEMASYLLAIIDYTEKGGDRPLPPW